MAIKHARVDRLASPASLPILVVNKLNAKKKMNNV